MHAPMITDAHTNTFPSITVVLGGITVLITLTLLITFSVLCVMGPALTRVTGVLTT